MTTMRSMAIVTVSLLFLAMIPVIAFAADTTPAADNSLQLLAVELFFLLVGLCVLAALLYLIWVSWRKKKEKEKREK